MFLKDLEANYRSGAWGIVRDLEILSNPWGFDPGTIPGRVAFWHGDRDLVAPLILIHDLARVIPHATEHVIPGEGHLLIFRYWKEILSGFNRSRTEPDESPDA